MKANSTNSSKHTLLTLLVIGVFLVCALIIFVYIELAATPQETANRYREQQKIEMLSPNSNQPIAYQDANAVQPFLTQEKSLVLPVELGNLKNEVFMNNESSSSKESIKFVQKEERNTSTLQEMPIKNETLERELTPINLSQETIEQNKINETRRYEPIKEKQEHTTVKTPIKENKKTVQAIDELF